MLINCKNHRITFDFYVIFQHLASMGIWNPALLKTSVGLYCIFNTMHGGDLGVF